MYSSYLLKLLYVSCLWCIQSSSPNVYWCKSFTKTTCVVSYERPVSADVLGIKSACSISMICADFTIFVRFLSLSLLFSWSLCILPVSQWWCLSSWSGATIVCLSMPCWIHRNELSNMWVQKVIFFSKVKYFSILNLHKI